MKNQFGHSGDVFEGIREIHDSLSKKAKQQKMLKELAVKLAALEGEWSNLEGLWPEAIDEIFS